MTESNVPRPTRDGSVIASVQRRLKRSLDDQAVEVERVRALTLQRLVEGAEDRANPVPAVGSAGKPEVDEAINVADPVEHAPTNTVRKPLAFRIAGLNEPAAVVPAEAEPEATPLVLFLGTSGPAWPKDTVWQAADRPAVETDAAADGVLQAPEPAAIEPAVAPQVVAVAAPQAVDVRVAESETALPTEVAAPAATVVEVAAPAVTVVDVYAYCPYCATILQPPPESDSPCARCKQQIVVRRIDGRTVWLMEAALPVFEAERQRAADEERWTAERARWLDHALATGAPKARVAKAAHEAPTDARVSAARDLYLASVDRSFEVATGDGRWADAARIRFDQALVLFDAAGAPVPALARDDA